jgi:hypothetical protein
MNLYKSNKYLSAVSIGTGWSKYLDKDTLDYKTLAGSYRALIGAIYKTNGPARMLDIMEYLNDEIIPDSKIKFNKNYNFWDQVMFLSLGFSSGILFSLSMFYLIL